MRAPKIKIHSERINDINKLIFKSPDMSKLMRQMKKATSTKKKKLPPMLKSNESITIPRKIGEIPINHNPIANIKRPSMIPVSVVPPKERTLSP